MSEIQKGHTNNPSGRPKGCKNKLSTDVKNTIVDILNENTDTIREDFKNLDSVQRLQLFSKFASFVIPKPQSVDINATIEAEINEEKNNIIDYISFIFDRDIMSLDTDETVKLLLCLAVAIKQLGVEELRSGHLSGVVYMTARMLFETDLTNKGTMKQSRTILMSALIDLLSGFSDDQKTFNLSTYDDSLDESRQLCGLAKDDYFGNTEREKFADVLKMEQPQQFNLWREIFPEPPSDYAVKK